MENSKQFMQCMDFQFQFLVLKYFETKDTHLSVSELYDLIAPSMANSGLMEGNEAKFHEVIEAEVQMLSKQYAAIRGLPGITQIILRKY